MELAALAKQLPQFNVAVERICYKLLYVRIRLERDSRFELGDYVVRYHA